MNLDVLLWFAGQLIIGAAIWGGIRADIKNIHLRIDSSSQRAESAHTRIDRLLEAKRS